MASRVESHPLQPAEPASAPDLSVVLVCWNNKDYVEPCLRSLFAANLRNRFDVVVVDNGSVDGSQEVLRETFPQVDVIQNDHNAGLSRASNQGIAATAGRYVLLLNNDTLVNGPALDALVGFLDATPDAAAAGGRLLNPDGTFQAAYADFSTLREEFLMATGLGERLWPGYPSYADSQEVKAVGWLSSACLLLRREALAQVGLLDEEYFIYGDETDLQYRLQRAGWKVYYLPSVTTIHYGGRSMDRWRRRKMVYRGRLLFYRKHYGWLRTAALRSMFASLSLAKMVCWCVAASTPRGRERAQREIRSNLDVLQLCWKLV
ncbi:MAG TPA: glycosyltransferase family 2 protein [Candidatus Margulisiibacteriota bacterium]|nr:glycosyltransferase family 2 protein [Candidatus Margulisiibacteriota bacterium]